MIVYTYQLAHHRALVKEGRVPLLDTTVKTGEARLAPTWEMVMGVKRGTMTEDTYRYWYRERLDFYWMADPDYWDWLLTQPVIAFGCYCPAGHFCHRHLLVDFLTRVTEVDYRGELLPSKKSNPT